MKNFKNSICVKGTPALCKAFASELEKIGYEFRTKECYPTSVTTYVGEGNYCYLLEGYATYLGDVGCIHMNLPQDWDIALVLAAEEGKPVTYKIGNKFEWGQHDKYILASVGEKGTYKVTLVNIETGNMWTYPVPVKDLYGITEDELKQIITSHRFKLIKK